MYIYSHIMYIYHVHLSCTYHVHIMYKINNNNIHEISVSSAP
jgi:hypothetical protein